MRSSLYILREYLCLAASIFAVTYLWRHLGSTFFDWLLLFGCYYLSMIIIGAIQHRLGALAHEATHGSLYEHQLVNNWVADIFCMWPLFANMDSYRKSHLDHHRYLNDPVKDPDMRRMLLNQNYRFPIGRLAFVRHFVFDQLMPRQTARYLWHRAKDAMLSEAQSKSRVQRWSRCAFYLAVAITLSWQGWWGIFFFMWIVPLTSYFCLFMVLREVAEHSHRLSDKMIHSSRVYHVHPLLRFAVFPYGLDYHLTHHLHPEVAQHKLGDLHNKLMATDAAYAKEAQICRGYFFADRRHQLPSVLTILSQ